ncbi:Protein TIC 214, partial [Dissostichus eleginoides]
YPRQGRKDFPPKALLPSRRAEIPSNRYSQLLQGRLTTETQDSREEGEKRKINEKTASLDRYTSLTDEILAEPSADIPVLTIAFIHHISSSQHITRHLNFMPRSHCDSTAGILRSTSHRATPQ